MHRARSYQHGMLWLLILACMGGNIFINIVEQVAHRNLTVGSSLTTDALQKRLREKTIAYPTALIRELFGLTPHEENDTAIFSPVVVARRRFVDATRMAGIYKAVNLLSLGFRQDVD